MKRFLSLLVVFASTGSALAQAPTPEQPILPRTTNILEAMISAGPVMLLLFLLSIFSVMLIIVFFLTIRRGAVVSSGYMATVDALLRKRDYLGLLAVSNRHGEGIARVVQKTLDFMTKNPNADFTQAREIARNGRYADRDQFAQPRHLPGGYRDDRPVSRLVRHSHRHYPVLRRTGLRAGPITLRFAFERH